MADDLRMALTNLLCKAKMAGDVDFLRDGVRILGQTLMDLEVSQHLQAEKNERTPERSGHRNGYRTHQWDTRVGIVELRVPRVLDGSFFPRLAELMDEAETDVLAYATFPVEHWRQIWSNNPLERVNKEIKRRTNVVGIFPNPDSIVRLVGSVLSEYHDECQVTNRYFSAKSLVKVTGRLDTIPLPLAAAR